MAEKYQTHRQLYELVKRISEPTLKMMADWLGDIFSAVDEGRPILYNQFTIYSELMVALDIQPLSPELWETIAVSFDKYALCESIDAAQEAGIPPELCSANKATIGDILLDKIPPPSMIALPTFPCDNSKITYQTLAHLTEAPTYFLDTPYWMDDKEAMEYWVNQFKGLISFLEEYSGRKMDYDRLKEVAEESNRCLDYWLEGAELKKLKPLPQSGAFASGLMAGLTTLGLPAATEAVKASLDELKGRIDRGETAVPEEKVRVIWFYYPIFWDTELTAWMDEMGAVTPHGMVSHFRVEPVDTSSPESIIRGLARRALETPMGRQGRGASDLWIEDCLNAVEEWQGDCVILAGHPGCKWLRGCYGLFRDIARERGIPVLLFDVDYYDPRIAPPEEYRAKIEDFLTTVMAY